MRSGTSPLTGSGTFVIKTATSTGGDVYTGNGDDVGTITCGATTGSLTVIKMVDNTANPDATGVPADFSIHVKDSSNAEVSGSPQPGSTTGTGYIAARRHLHGQRDRRSVRLHERL